MVLFSLELYNNKSETSSADVFIWEAEKANWVLVYVSNNFDIHISMEWNAIFAPNYRQTVMSLFLSVEKPLQHRVGR